MTSPSPARAYPRPGIPDGLPVRVSANPFAGRRVATAALRASTSLPRDADPGHVMRGGQPVLGVSGAPLADGEYQEADAAQANGHE